MKPERVLGVIFAMVKSSFICIGCILWFSWGNGNGRAAFRADFGTAVCRYRQSCRGGSAHTPWGNFLLVQKVTKNTLRGYTPKDPRFGNRVVERFILETISVAGLPTKPGTCQTTPAGLLCSGLQDKRAVASLFLLLFMVWQKLAGRNQLPLPAAPGAVRGEK